MAVGGFFAKFFGRTVSEAAAYGAGLATGPALRPVTRAVESEIWKLHPDQPVDAGTAAAIVAEAVELQAWGENEAASNGYSAERFAALVGEALNAPGSGELLALWRRGLIGDADFVHGLRKAKLEPRWDAPLEGLRDTLLSSEELAMGQQQGFVSEARANAEGGLQGVTEDRQQIRFEMAGLPPGVETALDLLRRRIIDEATFAQIVREGHTKTKYTGTLLQLQRRLLSAATYVRLFLKGWITRDEMHAGGAQWGYTPADLDLWYESEGRPATVHQIHIGYARGAKLPGAADEREAILTSVKQSDIRPEYGELLYAQRYTYPSAFVLRSLVQTGALTGAEGEKVLLESGWEPTLATKVADAWAGGGTTAAADSHVSKAQTQVWTALHRSYVNDRTDDATAAATLANIGVDGTAVSQVLQLWGHERELVRSGLSPAAIKKAYHETTFTLDEATARLVELGWSVADAHVYLPE